MKIVSQNLEKRNIFQNLELRKENEKKMDHFLSSLFKIYKYILYTCIHTCIHVYIYTQYEQSITNILPRWNCASAIYNMHCPVRVGLLLSFFGQRRSVAWSTAGKRTGGPSQAKSGYAVKKMIAKAQFNSVKTAGKQTGGPSQTKWRGATLKSSQVKIWKACFKYDSFQSFDVWEQKQTR